MHNSNVSNFWIWASKRQDVDSAYTDNQVFLLLFLRDRRKYTRRLLRALEIIPGLTNRSVAVCQ